MVTTKAAEPRIPHSLYTLGIDTQLFSPLQTLDFLSCNTTSRC